MPPEDSHLDVKFGPIELKDLPQWCAPLLVATVIVIALIYSWAHYGKDIYNPISKLEAALFTEAKIHFW